MHYFDLYEQLLEHLNMAGLVFIFKRRILQSKELIINMK